MRRREKNLATISTIDDVCVVVLRGEWDLSNHNQLRDVFLTAGTQADVLVDVRAVTFFDSTALSELIGAYKRLAARARRLETLVGDSNMQRLLQLTCLDGLFRIDPEREIRFRQALESNESRSYARASR